LCGGGSGRRKLKKEMEDCIGGLARRRGGRASFGQLGGIIKRADGERKSNLKGERGGRSGVGGKGEGGKTWGLGGGGLCFYKGARWAHRWVIVQRGKRQGGLFKVVTIKEKKEKLDRGTRSLQQGYRGEQKVWGVRGVGGGGGLVSGIGVEKWVCRIGVSNTRQMEKLGEG